MNTPKPIVDRKRQHKAVPYTVLEFDSKSSRDKFIQDFRTTAASRGVQRAEEARAKAVAAFNQGAGTYAEVQKKLAAKHAAFYHEMANPKTPTLFERAKAWCAKFWRTAFPLA